MKKAVAEKNIVIVLFITVLVIFSMAERDSKKLARLYNAVAKTAFQQHLAKVQQPSAPTK